MPTTSNPTYTKADERPPHPVPRLPNGERKTPPRGIPALPLWQTLVGALAAGAATWVALVPLLGADLVVRSNGATREVGLGAVVATALMVPLAALGVAALLRRFAARPRRVFLGVSATVFLLSLLGPLSAATAGAVLGLALLHVVVAGSVVPLVAGRLPERRHR